MVKVAACEGLAPGTLKRPGLHSTAVIENATRTGWRRLVMVAGASGVLLGLGMSWLLGVFDQERPAVQAVVNVVTVVSGLAGIAGYVWPRKQAPTPAAATVGGDGAAASGERAVAVNAPGAQSVEIVGRDKITNIQKPPASRSTAQLEAPPDDLIGRDAQLADMVAHLERGEGVAISGLAGQGGIGKTVLALAAAEKLRGRAGVQLQIDLLGTQKQPLAPEEALRRLISDLEPERGDLARMELPALQGLYRTLLSAQAALVLLDNAADGDQVRPLLPPAGCICLVTSRQRFALPGMLAVDLDVLHREDSVALLRRLCPRLGDADAGEIAGLCGDLPLALRIAGNTLACTPSIDGAAYAPRLRDARLKELKDPGDRNLDVEASIRVSYDLLEAPQQERWRALGVFPASFDRAAAAAVWQDPEGAAQRHVEALERRSLVRYDPKDGRFSLHDLPREFARARLAEEPDAGKAAFLRHAQHFLAISRFFDELYLNGGGDQMRALESYDQESSNLERALDWARKGTSDPKVAGVFVNLLASGNHVRALRQHPSIVVTLMDAGIEVARQFNDQASVGVFTGNKGSALLALGQYDSAEENLQRAAAMAEGRSDGQAHVAWLAALAMLELERGNPGAARTHIDKAWARSEGTMDGRRQASLLLRQGLISAALEEWPTALEQQKRARRAAIKVGDRIAAAHCLGNLGSVYFHQRRYRDAICCIEAALRAAQAAGDQRGEEASLGNLGSVMRSQANFGRAIVLHKEALALAKATGNLRGQANHHGNLGSVYMGLEQVDEAVMCFREAINLALSVPYPLGAAHGYLNWGHALKKQGDQPGAREKYEDALRIYEAIGSPHAERARKWLAELGEE